MGRENALQMRCHATPAETPSLLTRITTISQKHSWATPKYVQYQFGYSGCSYPRCDSAVVGQIYTGLPRSLVPSNFRCLVFDSLHYPSHPGI